MTPAEALASALALSITAPTDDKSRQSLASAEKIASGLSEVEVARAKKMAQVLVDAADEWANLKKTASAVAKARLQLSNAMKAAEAATIAAHGDGVPETEISQTLGVNRTTVRKWLGK